MKQCLCVYVDLIYNLFGFPEDNIHENETYMKAFFFLVLDKM